MYYGVEYIQKENENICIKKSDCNGFFYSDYVQNYCLSKCNPLKKYSYNKTCLEKCPNSHPFFVNENDIYKCVSSCPGDKKFHLYETNECVHSCNQNNYLIVMETHTCYYNRIPDYYPFRIEETNEYVHECGNYNNTIYFLKENENVCVEKEKCMGFYYYNNEESNLCVSTCKNLEYKFYIKEDKICLKKCPNDKMYYINDDFECLLDCPSDKPYHIYSTKECVEDCNETFKYKVEKTKACYDKIPDEYPLLIEDTNEYVNSCGYYKDVIYFKKENQNICIKKQNCNDFYYYQNNDSNLCVSKCSDYPEYKFYLIEDRICLSKCPNDEKIYYNDDFQCLLNCPSDKPYHIYSTKECVEDCNETFKYKVEKTKACYDKIPDEYPLLIEDTNEYVNSCGYYKDVIYFKKENQNICIKKRNCNGYFLFNNYNNNLCVNNCKLYSEYKYFLSSDNICLKECPKYNPFFINNIFECLNSCPKEKPYFLYDTKECIRKCEDNIYYPYYVEIIKTCFNKIPEHFPYQIENSNEYVNICPKNYPFLLDSSVCVKDCKLYNKFFNSNNICVDYCPENEKYALQNNNQCLSSCPLNLPFSKLNPNFCVSECKDDYYYVDLSKFKCLTQEQCDNEPSYECEIFLNNCPEFCKFCTDKSLLSNKCIQCNSNQLYYPTRRYSDEKYFTCYNEKTKPHNYILTSNYYYEKCYETCYSCSGIGNSNDHLCIDCAVGYIKEPEKENTTQCVIDCKYYYYYDKFNQYSCTNNSNCPSIAKYKIEPKKKCISSCSEDNIYIYTFGNECFSECPEGTIANENNECMEEDFSKCAMDKTISYIDRLDLNNKILLSYIEEYLSKYKNAENHVSRIDDRRNEYIILLYRNIKCVEELNSDVVFFISEECINILKDYYRINDFTFEVINYIRDNQPNQIQYFIFNTKTGDNLDLSLCNKTTNEVLIQISSLKKVDNKVVKKLSTEGINVFDLKSDFFTDICYQYSSEEGNDITLEDRVANYFQNMTLCDDNCKFNNINLDSLTANCSCSIDNNEFTNDIKDNKIIESYNETNRYNNFNVLKCASKAFKPNNIIYNYGFFSLGTLLIFSFTVFIFFIYKKFYGAKKISNLTQMNPPKNQGKKINKENLDKQISINKLNKTKMKIKKKSLEGSSNRLKDSTSKSFNNIDEKINKDIVKLSTKNKNDFYINNINEKDSKFDDKSFIQENFNNKKLNDSDLDEMDYINAIKYEKRSFFSFYLRKIKEHQPFINTFFIKDPFKPFIVKLLLFLILLSFYFLLNSLFINEKYITKKFHIKTYSFKILIVRIILVTTFGLLLNLFINCHFSIKKQIKNLLKYEKSQNIKLKMLEFVKSNDKKFLIFFSIMLLLNVFFFIYITSLCFVFKNTQSEWFCVSIITILLIQIFPFFSCLIYTSMRFLGLKLKIELFYKLSQILLEY